MKTLRSCIAYLAAIAMLVFGCTATAEIDLSNLSEEELISLRNQIDARLVEMHTITSGVVGASTADTIFEGNGCIISVASVDQNSCRLLVENNSDKDYGICVHALAINGMMTNCNPYLGRVDVPAGKKGFVSFEFSDWLIEYKPDKPYNNLSVMLWVYDNAKSYKAFETEILTISIDPTAQSNVLSMGADVVEDSGLSFSAISYTDNAITIAVVNNNSYYVDFDLINTSVNGWAFDTGISVYDIELFPGCQSVFDVSFSDVKIQGEFTNVTDFEFALRTRKAVSYSDEVITSRILFRKPPNEGEKTKSAIFTTRAALKKGDEGEAVLELQKNLSYLGFYVDTPDGMFDNKTQTAVKAFQQAHNLPVTGIADNDTQVCLIMARNRQLVFDNRNE